MADKKSKKNRWRNFFILLLILLVIGLISYAIGYQVGNKMMLDQAGMHMVHTWI